MGHITNFTKVKGRELRSNHEFATNTLKKGELKLPWGGGVVKQKWEEGVIRGKQPRGQSHEGGPCRTWFELTQ